MGVKGLLRHVAPAIKPGSIADFTGKTIAVDISCFLHRSLVGCAKDVVKEGTSGFYIFFIRRYIDLLLRHKCHVILVFDGKPLPAKKETNAARNLKRASDREKAEQLLLEGNHTEAEKYFQSGASITPLVIEHTIAEFSKIPNVDIIVAPYEADAQLYYLAKQKIADAVVSEDSDLVIFGCPTIIYKLRETGECQVYQRSELTNCFKGRLSSRFDFDTFRYLCIMSGCDYFPDGFSSIGLKKATEFFGVFRDTTNLVKLLKQGLCSRYAKVIVTDRHVRDFLIANYTFLYQIVYCPMLKKQVPLCERPSEYPVPYDRYLRNHDMQCFWFAGEVVSDENARRHAFGNLNLDVSPKHDVYQVFQTWSIHHPENMANRKPVEDADIVVLSSKSLPNIQVAGFKRSQTMESTSPSTSKLSFAPPPAKVPRVIEGAQSQSPLAFVKSGESRLRPASQPVGLQNTAQRKKTFMQPSWKFLSSVIKKKAVENSNSSQKSITEVENIETAITDSCEKSVLKTIDEKVETAPSKANTSVVAASKSDDEGTTVLPEAVSSAKDEPEKSENELKAFLKASQTVSEKSYSSEIKKLSESERIPETQLEDMNINDSMQSFDSQRALLEVTIIVDDKTPKKPVKPIEKSSLTTGAKTSRHRPKFHDPFFHKLRIPDVGSVKHAFYSKANASTSSARSLDAEKSSFSPSSSEVPKRLSLSSLQVSPRDTPLPDKYRQFFSASHNQSSRKLADGTVVSPVTPRRHISRHSPRAFREVFRPGSPPRTACSPKKVA